MNALWVELRKEKRTGVISVLPAVGILGAAYAFANFIVRKDTLLNLPLAPMDVLLTQLYGMIVVLNMFGIVVASCMPLQISDSDSYAYGSDNSAKSGAYQNRDDRPAARLI